MNVKQWLFDFSTILVAVMIAEVIILVLQEIKRVPVPATELPLGGTYDNDHKEVSAF